jgi:hypothetical protein
MATVPQSTDASSRDAEGESSASIGRARDDSVIFLVVVLLTLLPLMATLVSIAHARWHPASDLALEVLRIRDVGGRHTPLVGVYSRFGWNHPGPVLFWLLAPFRWLRGNTGVLLGVGVVNGAAIVGALVLARRRGGLSLAMLTGLVVLLLVHGLGSDLLVNPWNPWVPVLPFLAYLVLAWSVAERDFATLPLLVAVGSFVVQVHIGYAPLVVGTAVAAGAVAWLRRSEPATSWSAKRALAVAGVVGLVLWLPPLVQQFTGRPGNLGEIVAYFRHPTEAPAGWRVGFGIMGEELGVHAPWITGHDVSGLGAVASASSIPAITLLAVVAVVGILAARRGASNALTFALLVDLAAVLGVVAGSRVEGFVVPYLVRWWWVIAACAWLSIGWSAVSLLARTRLATVAVATIAGVGVTLAAAGTVAAVPALVPQQQFSSALTRLAPAVARKLRHDREYLVRWVDQRNLGAVGVGMFLALEERGYKVQAPRAFVQQFGSWRTAPSGGVSEDAVTVVAIADEGESWTRPRDAVLLARYEPLTLSQRRRTRALERAIRARLPARTRSQPLPADTEYGRWTLVRDGADGTSVEALYALERRDNGYSVYLTDASA